MIERRGEKKGREREREEKERGERGGEREREEGKERGGGGKEREELDGKEIERERDIHADRQTDRQT